MASTPKLRMLAGPNGSGKSTLLNHLSALSRIHRFPLGYVLNPDELERELTESGRLYLGGWGARVDKDELEKFVERHPLRDQLPERLPSLANGALIAPHGYEPGYYIPVLCDFLRARWISARESFMFETVFSIEAKLDLLRNARTSGYRTYLYYICTDNVLINRERIANRVLQGGHPVPDDKLEARYGRSLTLLPDAIRLTDRSYHFDNSARAHRLVAEFEGARLVKTHDDLPEWFVQSVVGPLGIG